MGEEMKREGKVKGRTVDLPVEIGIVVAVLSIS